MSDIEFDNSMQTLECYTRDGLTPHSRIELDSLSSTDQYTEPSACKFPGNESEVSKIIQAQPQAEESKQKPTSNQTNMSQLDTTIPSSMYETTPPFVQGMINEPCTCKGPHEEAA